ncbi:MAG: hypothetical protein KIT54_05885 [Phycisphaeraceae bacterium]|nr:hypothetical protein [Phycisphaeraceae bacterium]
MAADLTAVQIAQPTGLNRSTVNRLLACLRERMSRACELKRPGRHGMEGAPAGRSRGQRVQQPTGLRQPNQRHRGLLGRRCYDLALRCRIMCRCSLK